MYELWSSIRGLEATEDHFIDSNPSKALTPYISSFFEELYPRANDDRRKKKEFLFVTDTREGRAISDRELSAIRLRNKIGTVLAKKHPEIADDWERGMIAEEIAEKYNVSSEYGLNFEIARGAIYHALGILLTDDERKKIREKFNRLRNEEKGLKMKAEKKGLFGLSEEEKKKNREDALRTHLLNIGITPWDDRAVDIDSRKTERELLFFLAKKAEYQYQEGRAKGRPNFKKIANELNKIFHDGQNMRKAPNLHTIYRLHMEKKGSYKRVQTRFSKEEDDLLYQLSQDSNYMHKNGDPDHKKIAKKLNQVFYGGGDVRNVNSTRVRLHKIRKKRKK